MGLFDHLFKSKSPHSDEASLETGDKPSDPAKRSDPAERSVPSQRADPSAFLHPKSFVPRGATPLTPPGKPGVPPAVRKPAGADAPAASEEIVLTLGDVLSRIPTHYLKAGQHDPKRELRFSINDLSSDIARGRAAVPLSRIAKLMPDIFVQRIGRDEDSEVRLPLQKLVEQIGLLRSRPAPVSSEKVVRPASTPPVLEPLLPSPDPEIRTNPAGETAQTIEPHRETLRDLRAPIETIIELKPAVVGAAPQVTSRESGPDTQPTPEEPAPASSAAFEAPAFAPPLVRAPETLVPAPPISPEAVLVSEPLATAPDRLTAEPPPHVIEVIATPPPAEDSETVMKRDAAPEEAVPALPPDLAPLPGTPPHAVEIPPAPSESSAPDAERVAPILPAESLVQEASEPEVGGERIHLSLAAILRECPPEIIVGELPIVPDNVRISLPFAPIDRQLVMGNVEVSSVRFVAALPIPYQKYFSARIGVKVPLPLEEVFQNLPSPATEAFESVEPHPQFLEPAISGSSTMLTIESAVTAPVGGAEETVLSEERPESSAAAGGTAVAEVVPQEPSPDEPRSAPAATLLDLPAFHYFAPPPPRVIVPDPAEQPPAVSIAPAGPAAEATWPSQPATVFESEVGVSSGGFEPVAPLTADTGQAWPEAEVPSLSADVPAVVPIPQMAPEDALSATSIEELPEVFDQPSANLGDESESSIVATAEGEKMSLAPREANSPSVFDSPTQTIQPPQIIRPFIVLPPPIFGYSPTPEGDDRDLKYDSQITERESITLEFTNDSEFGITLFPEAAGVDRPTSSEIEEEERQPSEAPQSASSAVAAEFNEASALPGIINIDFSDTFGLPEDAIPSAAAPLPESSGFPPQSLVEPSSDQADGEAMAMLDSFEPWPSFQPEPSAGPAADVAPPFTEADEFAPPTDFVSTEKPVEVLPAGVVFVTEGRFTERPPAVWPEPEPEPLSEEELAAQTHDDPVTASTTTESDAAPPVQAAPEVMPVLSLPRFIPEVSLADMVAPPALPLRRFDQDALQALFMTDEFLDLPRISRLAAQLPGVHACVIATRDQACTGGTLPEGFDLAALLGLAPRVGEAAGRMPIGALKHFTLYGERYSVSFFERNGLSLCAVHRSRSFIPGVREKLVAIADELSK